MDPFDRLPWFAVRDILCLLPDLPTLHRLHAASPAIAAFLRYEDGIFPYIVETIISHNKCDLGLLPPVRALLRMLVFIWWQTSPSESNSELKVGTNPLPTTYEEFYRRFAAYMGSTLDQNGRTCFMHPWEDLEPSYADAPLPKSTPPIILCRLLSLSSRVRQIIHVYFHDMVARCMMLQPGYDLNDMPFLDPKAILPDSSGRPEVRIPTDIGPLSWIEEQRLLRSFLRIYVFFELQHAILAGGLYNTEKAALSLQEDNIHSFKNKLRPIIPQDSQIGSLIEWLVFETGSIDKIEHWMTSASIPKTAIYCCPHFRPLTARQLKWREDNLGRLTEKIPFRLPPETFMVPNSPRRFGAAYGHYIFGLFGVYFWDGMRVKALGFIKPGMNVGLEE
ncbi:hypothetical protein AOR_1_2932174 [Paecilomyces variotii No. 5]|uniref:Uncharacterized protein n=1 Tax=Byssochlamys spectabilis (strain No. 5 / NBRC 109023) TaxID=1356009 RepID=V5FR23_BYSSN|nr:hypothetical protein AOR_1_2932174 [Paecilomyces variotii No. 5]